ncbi:transcriptional regulator NrdR [Macrococcoides caseolyticum]|uniref:Transcriptional repressor NrdR n=2 Tax=Macrococcoides caseolyticum TaxID=69966 RepID=A0A2N0VTE2_9STAP|nr:transcriptional regulator NrdR [Macrococcus caseolyticus]ARQ04929.1 Transcriptional repressor NrdR [Macrococcus caseolyticus]MDJ1088111.1 transcriptional regulator NrdR [Macrococcus caseolyticus]MDJ1090776.1 transcriptional regulator NrdR [Macrococcus caseolyticus]MDJ1108651.1 transcriptional regulator NrdR [Macrococcus caseolyticus]MDJ1152618.1 transcriptional regulator NrdR [Macrococcus caseolyticus]
MKCPKCSFNQSKVVDSRHADDMNAIRRRRECEQCGTRFTTFERVELQPLIVVKKDGTRQAFNRDKIVHGLVRACEKRPVPYESLEQITDAVENTLREKGQSEISSVDIGEIVMEHLMQLDQVSYVRFASVYKEFKDVDQLLRTMSDILNEKNKK